MSGGKRLEKTVDNGQKIGIIKEKTKRDEKYARF